MPAQIVNTVRVSDPGNKDTDESFGWSTISDNLTSFLSANAIRAWNSLDGIDWCSSNNSTPCAVAHLSPTLPIHGDVDAEATTSFETGSSSIKAR